MADIFKRKFYLWWLSVLLVATFCFWAYYMGFVATIWQTDVTMITSLITLGFIASNILLGWVSYNVRNPAISKQRLIKASDTCWFASEQLMALGMLGTVIGLIHMLGSASGSSLTDTTAIQGLLGRMWESMGLALYTNAVGLVFSIVLKLQVYFISGELEDAAQEV